MDSKVARILLASSLAVVVLVVLASTVSSGHGDSLAAAKVISHKRVSAQERARLNLQRKFDADLNNFRQDFHEMLAKQNKAAEKAAKEGKPSKKAILIVAKPPSPEVEHCKEWATDEQRDAGEASFLAKTMCQVDKLLAVTNTELDFEGIEQHGSFVVQKVEDEDNFYLHIVGTANHKISVHVKGSDGFEKDLHGYGEIFSGAVHNGRKGIYEYVECRDYVTGDVEWFRFRFN